jgi:hypothetical protein
MKGNAKDGIQIGLARLATTCHDQRFHGLTAL